jgi:RHS repeat-associated protein
MMRNGVRRTITSFTGTTRDVNDPNATMSRLLILHHPDGSKTYHCDQVGSTIARTNDSGAVIGKAEYSAYGICFWKQGDMDTPFQYNGQWGVQTDSNGLLNMRARYYSPNLMRFLNADPIGFSGGQNWFAYADGDPISKSAPFGLWGWRNTLSLALDFIPIVGTVKAAVEVVAGYDFIAGEEVNRGIAAAGLVAGLVPGGKAAVKGGSKLFSTAVKNADEAAEIGEMVVKNGDGFIYKRTNPFNGDEYIGQSQDLANYELRQYRHDLKLNVGHEYEAAGKARPGLDLDILEESWIRNSGGLRKEGGTLVDGRHQMNPERYLDGVNQRLWNYQKGMLFQNGVLKGGIQSINQLK